MPGVLASVFGFALAGAALADIEYFANANGGNDAWDGLSATHVEGTLVGPKETIGAAVELANNDGVNSIVTLAPGRYAKGEYVAGDMTNRVVITASKLKIRSSGNKNNTFIVGNHDPSNYNGIGPAAVRCIYIQKDLGSVSLPESATNIVIEGVTICNGATAAGMAGGGVYCVTPDAGGASLLIDCVVSNCAAEATGGGIYRQYAYRTLFVDNYAGTSGSAMAFGRMLFCVVTGNRGPATTHNMFSALNCTFACNEQYAFLGGYAMNCYNCLSFGNGTDNGCSPKSNDAFNMHDSVCAAPTRIPGTATDMITDASSLQCVSTAFHDWRLLSDSPAIGKGKGSYITDRTKSVKLPPGYSLADYYGNPVDTSGSLDCGAVLEPAFTPVAGRINFADPFCMEGMNVRAPKGSYHYSTNGAHALRIRSAPTNGTPFMVCWKAADGATVHMVPQYDGWTSVFLPLAANSSITVSTYTATLSLYVNKASGSNDYDGKSPVVESETRGPKRTLQAAANAALDGGYTLVYVAPGVYDEGGGIYEEGGLTISNRVIVGSRFNIGFIAAEGPGTATIKGAPDPDTGGLGPNAMRCFFPRNRSYLQGFILTDGYTHNVFSHSGRGGAAYFGNASTAGALADCIVTNCHSYEAIVYYGFSWRSKFFDNETTGGEFTKNAVFSSCLFAGNTVPSNYGLIGYLTVMRGCTVDMLGSDFVLTTGNSPTFYGNLVAADTAQSYIGTGYNAVTPTPYFVDRESRDYRLGGLSPAVRKHPIEQFYDRGANFWFVSDVSGNTLQIDNGRVTSGAVHETLLPMYGASATGGGSVSVSGGQAGTHFVTADAEITVEASSAKRPFVGLEVDGQMLPPTQTSYTFNVSPADTVSHAVRAIYGKTWYINALTGNDSNGGGTDETPRQTIRSATTNCVWDDVVLVAPGTYGELEGVQFHPAPALDDDKTSPIDVGSRVFVPNGVTVRSTHGPESTVIVGRAATHDTDTYGNGPDAVRCVMLNGSDARLQGFTLTGGHTSTGSASRDDNDGGAVMSRTARVLGCIITNNFSSRNGAVFRTRAFDCIIKDNHATTCASVGRESYFYRCLIDGNKGEQQAIQYFYRVDSCTFGDGNTDLSGNPAEVINYGGISGGKALVVNTLIKGLSGISASHPYMFSNCVLNAASTLPTERLYNCIVTNSEMIALDTNYRPIVGSNAGIDRGDPSLLHAEINDGLDLSGGPRITNGAMDIGAMEADWKPTYSEYLLGGRRLTVTNASSEVYANASRQICLPSGCVEGTVTVSNRSASRLNATFLVEGTGSFNIFIDGSLYGSYAYSEEKRVVCINIPSTSFGIKFEYVPGEGDSGGAILDAMCLVKGMSLTFR